MGWLPLVPVGADPQISRHYAEVLLTLIKDANRGRPIEFALTLTAQDMIEGKRAYTWGEERWDCICAECGAVWQSTNVAEEVCSACQMKGQP